FFCSIVEHAPCDFGSKKVINIAFYWQIANGRWLYANSHKLKPLNRKVVKMKSEKLIADGRWQMADSKWQIADGNIIYSVKMLTSPCVLSKERFLQMAS